jgi:small subunit ribosomal protein S18
MAREKRGRTKREDRDRRPKKKISILDQESVTWIDYKDVNLLRRFMSERAKIRARRVTGNDAQQQRAVARAIRLAREMALLPYSVRQVTHRSKGGKGRDRDGGTLREPRESREVREGRDELRDIPGAIIDTPAPVELDDGAPAIDVDEVTDATMGDIAGETAAVGAGVESAEADE